MQLKALHERLIQVSESLVGHEALDAYLAIVQDYVGSQVGCVLVDEDENTVDLLVARPAHSSRGLFGSESLQALVADQRFFLHTTFALPRPLRPLFKDCQWLAGLRILNAHQRGWLLLGGMTDLLRSADEIQRALYLLKDKVLINLLGTRKNRLEQQYDSLFTTIPHALVRVEETSQQCWVNEAASRLLGLEAGQHTLPVHVVSRAMLQLIERAVNRDVLRKTATFLFSQPDFRVRDWIWNLGERVLSVLSEPIANQQGRIWLLTDVSEIYHQQEMLRERNEKLADANLEINNLIGVIAHDLKSPLANLSATLQYLAMVGPLNEEQAESVEHGHQTIRRGLRLINSIVYYNSLESSKRPLELTGLSLNECLEELVATYEEKAQQKQIVIHLTLPETEIQIRTDQDRLLRILDNLLSNALKFSPIGKAVAIRLYQREQRPVLEIEDQGPGITPEDRQKLFKRFQRLSAQPTNGESSSGLGLSIVKLLAEELSISIEVDSEPGEGATFRLVF